MSSLFRRMRLETAGPQTSFSTALRTLLILLAVLNHTLLACGEPTRVPDTSAGRFVSVDSVSGWSAPPQTGAERAAVAPGLKGSAGPTSSFTERAHPNPPSQQDWKAQQRTRRLHSEWQSGLWEKRNGRRLAQAPASVQTLSTRSDCRSVTCGGQCCDTFYTYGSAGNSTCTTPLSSCSASGQCQFSSQSSPVCLGMVISLQAFPTGGVAENPSNQVGFACPANANEACSYLNTYSSDMSYCTVGTCITTPTGGLNCVPVIRDASNFGCATAIQTYTANAAATGGASIAGAGAQAGGALTAGTSG